MKNSVYIKTVQKVLCVVYKMELGSKLRPIERDFLPIWMSGGAYNVTRTAG